MINGCKMIGAKIVKILSLCAFSAFNGCKMILTITGGGQIRMHAYTESFIKQENNVSITEKHDIPIAKQ